MKTKHNKKRNTAFLYECLIKELTVSTIKNDTDKKSKIIKIIKEYFSKGAILKEELDIYDSILQGDVLKSRDLAYRFLFETKKDFENLDRKVVFNTQTNLIKTINETLSTAAFANFVSNYKDIASAGAYLNSSLKAKSRLIVENRLVKMLMAKQQETKEMKHIDNLTYKTFVNKFNDTYANSLRQEQKDLLMNYIISFSDNGLGLKSFLNEEISRLKEEVHGCTKNEKIVKNKAFSAKIKLVLEKLESFSGTPITEQVVREVFYIQDLILEVKK